LIDPVKATTMQPSRIVRSISILTPAASAESRHDRAPLPSRIHEPKGRNLTSKPIPERIRWAVRVMAPDPGDRLLEIGCGPGVAVSAVCEHLADGRITAIDRSPTAIRRAAARNAGHVAAGRAVLRTADLESLRPADLPDGQGGFDKVFAMNVNLFWVRAPARELELIRALLKPGGALFLFYGYGTPGRGLATVPGALAAHLTGGGFTVEALSGPSVVGVVARPVRPRRPRA
jgi:SAM-dependent methyltransferase